MRILKRLLLAVLLLGGLWLGLAATGWLPRLDDTQRAALAQMDQPLPEVRGRNGFALLWLLPYAVPEEARDAVMAEDMERFKPRALDDGTPMPESAATRYPRRVPKDAPAVISVCKNRTNSDCLADVREDRAAADTVLAAHASLLDPLHALEQADALRTPFQPWFAMPLPAYQLAVALPPLEAAIAFDDGRIDDGLERICRQAAAWRRFRSQGDILISDMIALAIVDKAAGLYSAMRAELPLDHPVPAVCAQAFAQPQPSERSLCTAMRLEFAMGAQAMRDPGGAIAAFNNEPGATPNPAQRLLGKLLFKPEATVAYHAQTLAPFCDSALDALPVAQWPKNPPPCGLDDRLFNPIGCTLADIATPNLYRDYAQRPRTAEDQLRLLALSDWLAQQPDPVAAFDQRPDTHRRFEGGVTFSNGLLTLTPLGKPGTPWSIPLPGSRVKVDAEPATATPSDDTTAAAP